MVPTPLDVFSHINLSDKPNRRPLRDWQNTALKATASGNLLPANYISAGQFPTVIDAHRQATENPRERSVDLATSFGLTYENRFICDGNWAMDPADKSVPRNDIACGMVTKAVFGHSCPSCNLHS